LPTIYAYKEFAMTRGLGGHSPSNVAHYLKGIDFPARKEDLLRQAKDNGAEPEVIEMIENMPDAEYETAADVMKGYSEADHSDRR